MMFRIYVLSLLCFIPLLSVAATTDITPNNNPAIGKTEPAKPVVNVAPASPIAPHAAISNSHPQAARKTDATNVQPAAEEKKKPEVLPTREALLTQQESDFFIGKHDAKITIFEYSSLNCPHCANFHREVFKKLKAEYIDKGLVKYVYRDFPLNRVALAGSKLAHCSGKDRFFDFLTSLFESQKVWAFNNSYMDSLLNIAKLGGISEEKFKACEEDKKLEDFLVKRAQDASNVLKIESTPNFFVNGEQLTGEVPYIKFKELLDKKLLAEK